MSEPGGMPVGGMLGVVVPVLDEIARLGACLDAIDAALRELSLREPGVRTRVVVVDDGSVDGSDALADARPGVELVRSAARHVGIARARGAEELLRDSDPGTLWIATTDGDSRVPRNWALDHLDVARSGAGALLGSIRPDPDELDDAQIRLWHELNPPGERHGYIHGANLGVRGDHYVRVGGFAPVSADEDVELVHRLRAAGVGIASSDAAPVITSARTDGRVPAGFAHYVAGELRGVRSEA